MTVLAVQNIKGQITGTTTLHVLAFRKTKIRRAPEFQIQTSDGLIWVRVGDSIALNLRLDVSQA